MELNKVIEIVNNFRERKERYINYIDNHELAASALDNMVRDVSRAINDEETTVTKEDRRLVDNLLKDLMVSYIKNTHDDILIELINASMLLTHNWLLATEQNKSIDSLTALIDLIDLFDTTQGLIKSYKYAIDEIRLSKEFSPPSYDVSQRYLEAIDKQLNGGNDNG